MRPNLKKLWGMLGLTFVALPAFASVAWADITEKDVLVLGRLAGLLRGSAGEVQVAVVSDGGSSRADAETFLRIVGQGKPVGNLTLTATQITPKDVQSTNASILLIPDGLDTAQLNDVFAAASQRKLATISTSEACLQIQRCAISMRTAPAVDIKMSVSAAKATGVDFGSTFRMMIKEVP